MGYNATVVVLVDQLDQIEKDPEFGKKLVAAIRSFSRSQPDRMPYVTGQTLVVQVEHADTMQIVAVGGNTGRTIGWGGYRDDDARLIQGLVDQQKLRKRKKGDTDGAQ